MANDSIGNPNVLTPKGASIFPRRDKYTPPGNFLIELEFMLLGRETKQSSRRVVAIFGAPIPPFLFMLMQTLGYARTNTAVHIGAIQHALESFNARNYRLSEQQFTAKRSSNSY